MPINYCLEDDSYYYFENISKIWLQDLGLFDTRDDSYFQFADRVVKFHVLGVTLELIATRSFVTVNDVFKSLSNEFVKRKLNLPIEKQYLEPLGPYDLSRLKSYLLSNFWDVFSISDDRVEVRSEISKPNRETYRKFQELVIRELKEQEKRVPKHSEITKPVLLGEPMNSCMETVINVQNELAKQYVKEFFEATMVQPTVQQQQQLSHKLKTGRIYNPKHYQLKYMKTQTAFRKEDWQRPYGFDDDVVQRLLNGEDVPIKDGPSIKMGENTGKFLKKPISSQRDGMKNMKPIYSPAKY